MPDALSLNVAATAKLSDVASINPRIGDKPAANDLVSFVPMAALSAETASVVVEEVRAYSEVSKGYTPFQDGDVLVAKITPCFENNKIGQARLTRAIGLGSTEFHVVRPHSGQADARFLMHFLRQDHVRREGERKMTGSAGQRRVPEHVLADLDVPLPSLAEQRRIAAILDGADALRAKRRATLVRLDEMAQAIFVEMFGDLRLNTSGWESSQVLGDVAEVTSGITKGRKLPAVAVRSVPYLAVANVQDRALDLTNTKQIDASEDEIARYRLQPNDLVLTEGGDPDKLGRGVLWHSELPECIHQNHIFRVRLRSKVIHPLFLNWLVGSEHGKAYFLRSAKQTTGIASINMTQLRAFPLRIPPFPLQEVFAKRLDQLATLRLGAERFTTMLEVLFASLQHRAFTGAR